MDKITFLTNSQKQKLGIPLNEQAIAREDYDKLSDADKKYLKDNFSISYALLSDETKINASIPVKKMQLVADNNNNILSLAAVNEETNYEDMSNELRNELSNENKPLYGALFYCEYGRYPYGLERPEIMDVDGIISNIKKTQLPKLRALSYDELRKAGKLNRLQVLDLAAYNRLLQKDDDETDKK